MGDKNLMENILLLEKGVCDLFLHGTIESSTSSVHQAFSTALHDSLGMQDTIYDMMAEKGWYPAEQAEQKKIDSVRQKFSSQQANCVPVPSIADRFKTVCDFFIFSSSLFPGSLLRIS